MQTYYYQGYLPFMGQGFDNLEYMLAALRYIMRRKC